MGIEQRLLQEIEESKRWLNLEKDESTYKRDLTKRIELINWVLENMKNTDIPICEVIESKMYELLDKIKEMDSTIEADPLHSELRILDWIFYQVCSNEIRSYIHKIKTAIFTIVIITIVINNFVVIISFCSTFFIVIGIL
jgi:predicted HAD superfamily phosphohydrolase